MLKQLRFPVDHSVAASFSPAIKRMKEAKDERTQGRKESAVKDPLRWAKSWATQRATITQPLPNRFAHQGVRAIRPIALSSPIDVEGRKHRIDDNDRAGDDASLHILSFASIYMIFGQY